MSTVEKYTFLSELGIQEDNCGVFDGKNWFGSGPSVVSLNPTSGEPIARISTATAEEYERCVEAMLPPPERGQIVLEWACELRERKEALGKLISLEMGKILPEGLGEVQEVIDMCEYAVGLSRQIGGFVFPSERPGHRLLEVWNPLGCIGIVTAFNFPCAVFGWNASLSLVCGNCSLWKGSSSTPLVTLAVSKMLGKVLEKHGHAGVSCSVTGSGRVVGDRMLSDSRLKLISFTGSTEVGRRVCTVVNSDLGRRTILELGGNNAVIGMKSANLELLLQAVVFGSVGTAGQRCTTTRRLLLHDSIFDVVVPKLVNAYKQVIETRIGDPLDPKSLMGPLVNSDAVKDYQNGLKEAVEQRGKVIVGGKLAEHCPKGGYFVEPTIVQMPSDAPCLQKELFVPILYLIRFQGNLEEAIRLNNGVPQGLSSALFTQDLSEMFQWIGTAGSDCGLVNVNVGTSGAEIGGAFGGEKETGGGRESGSDSWKQYMRRSTCTINYSSQLPLAQGISFT